MTRRVAFIASHVDHAPQYESIASGVRAVELHFVLLNAGASNIETNLRDQGRRVTRIRMRGKRDYIAAIWAIRRYLRSHAIDIALTQFHPAHLLGLLGATFAGVDKRILFRRHGLENHLWRHHAIWYDRAANRLSSKVVVPSRVLAEKLPGLEGLPADKIAVIEHGIDVDPFNDVDSKRVNVLRAKYGIDGHAPVIGVIARYEMAKGFEYLVPAFRDILTKHAQAMLVLANTRGRDARRIRELLSELPGDSYREIEFEPDYHALYRLFDVFVHVPTHPLFEAFGKTYVEALAARIPSVFTLSGIAGDFIEHRKTAWVVPYKDQRAITEAIFVLCSDEKLRARLADTGYARVKERFPLPKMIHELEALLLSI